MPNSGELTTLISGRLPLIVIESTEEAHLLKLLGRAAGSLRLPFFKWTVTEGLHRQEQGFQPQAHNARPTDLLHHIKTGGHPGIYLLLDFHPYLDDARHIRLLKEIAQNAGQNGQTLVLLSYRLQLPAELQHLAARYDLAPPGREALERMVREVALNWGREHGRKVQVEGGALAALVRSLAGLSLEEARSLAQQAICDDGAVSAADLPPLNRAKYALLGRSGLLACEHETARFAEVGGLQRLKQWLEKRRAAFLDDHGIPNLPPPKGVMLLGVQGCGKSLAAKAVAGTWQLPLLRLDLGAVYDKFFGESERNLRDVLRTAEAMAPCVLWLDEVEKGVATDSDDSGTSRRLLGTLLTWMAERSARVFLVATANDIGALPPELVRKGRLDEIFFVDLPDQPGRRAILAIHLEKRGLDPDAFELEDLAAACAGFSGAEIEQAVVAGLYAEIGGSGRLDNTQLATEIAMTRPLSVVMAERIAALRAWAEERTVPAD